MFCPPSRRPLDQGALDGKLTRSATFRTLLKSLHIAHAARHARSWVEVQPARHSGHAPLNRQAVLWSTYSGHTARDLYALHCTQSTVFYTENGTGLDPDSYFGTRTDTRHASISEPACPLSGSTFRSPLSVESVLRTSLRGVASSPTTLP